MSMNATVESVSGLHEAPPFFDPEEDTLVPPLSMGYTNPPSFIDAAPATSPPSPDTNEAIIEAAMGAHRRQMVLIALGGVGLALGVLMALLV